ncbi:MAG: hypothetical protein ACRDPR_02025, partial [Nocardioidaceae bacterium]
MSDRGSATEFKEFADAVGKHPAVLQTFHPWGNGLNQAIPRWQQLRVRPMLHISTMDDQTLGELITPQSIAQGAGDNYLLRLNSTFAETGTPTYVRPLGEANRCLNAWSAVTCGGSARGAGHT